MGNNDKSPIIDFEVPENLEEIIRESVYHSLAEMPEDMRRAQKMSYIMSMIPEGANMTRKQVEEIIDIY